MAWLAKNAIRTDGSAKTNATTAKTPVFAQSTGSRFGTAVKLARIMPVEYSPVITSTPRAAIASCEALTPASAMSSGWRSARSCGLIDRPVRGGHRGEDHRQGDRQEYCD